MGTLQSITSSAELQLIRFYASYRLHFIREFYMISGYLHDTVATKVFISSGLGKGSF